MTEPFAEKLHQKDEEEKCFCECCGCEIPCDWQLCEECMVREEEREKEAEMEWRRENL